MHQIKLIWEKVIPSYLLDENKEFLENNGGLYLWVITGNPPRVCYVGETWNFLHRLRDHFRKILAGRYLCLNPPINKDYLDFLKGSFDGKTIEELNKNKDIYCQYLNNKRDFSFTKSYLDEDSLKVRLEHLKRLEFAFATVKVSKKLKDSGESIRKQVEAALITGIMIEYRSISGCDLKMKNAGNFCRCVIGDISKNPETELEIVHEGITERIPQEVVKVKNYFLNKNRSSPISS